MKKIYLILLGIAISAFILNGQISLNYSTHRIIAGDSHDFKFANNTSEGVSGNNIIWDYSGLKYNGKTLTSHMLNPANIDKSNEIPQANTIIEEFGNYFYFNVENNIMEQYGAVSCNTITKYDKPFLKLKFPFTYGDKATGDYSGIQLSNNSQVPVKGTYEVESDGYGTLILPGNITIDNVLRVKQTRTIDYGNNSENLTETTYRWYSSNVRYPLLVIIKYKTSQKEYISQTAVYAHAGEQLKSATSIPPVNADLDLQVFPNPYNDKLTINYAIQKSGKVKIELYDNEGKLINTIVNIKKQDAGNYNLTLSAGKLGTKAGIYYVRATFNDNSIIKKIIKQ